MQNKEQNIGELYKKFKFLRKLANDRYDQIESIIRRASVAEYGFKASPLQLEINGCAYDMKEIHLKLHETIDELLDR